MMQHLRLITQRVLVAAALAGIAFAQNVPAGVTGAPIFQNMRRNAEALKHYTHQMQRTVLINGEQKSSTLSLVRYVNGERQVIALSAPPQRRGGRGLRHAVAAHKKEEMKEYVERLDGLLHRYLAPGPDVIRTLPEKTSMTVNGEGLRQIEVRGLVQPSDSLKILTDTATGKLVRTEIETSLDGDPVHLQISFSTLPDGLVYPAKTTFSAPKKKLQVQISTFNYERSEVDQQPGGTR
jgi:hypothetical protein